MRRNLRRAGVLKKSSSIVTDVPEASAAGAIGLTVPPSTSIRHACGLPAARELELRAQALEAFRVIGCRGWGRVDFLMDEQGNAYYLEVNTAPGMTDHSLVPMAARVAGISYDELVLRVLALASLG